MATPFCIITTTVPDRAAAKVLGELLVREKLAACVQISDIESIYHWEETLHCDSECRLTIKTRHSMFKTVERAILQNHPYKVPQIVMVQIDEVSQGYGAWIDEETERFMGR